MKRRVTRILCVDDHAFLIDGLKSKFDLHDDLEFVGSLSSADDLVNQIGALRPDVVLLDIEMPGSDPFDAVAEIKRLHPNVRCIFLSAFVRDHYISSAIKAGAWGYFSKGDDADDIIDSVRKVSRGEFAFSPKVRARCQPVKGVQRNAIAPPSSRLDGLTPREEEVLRLIGKGLSRSQIAQTICRSPKTIDGHREALMEKLDIHDRAELVRFAIREGLVEA